MPPTVGLGGWLAYLGPSYWCACLSGYTDLGWMKPGNWDAFTLLWPIQVAYLLVLAMLKDVGYLLIAIPVAFNHLGIRHDCATSLLMLLVIGSSLWRPWSLLLFCDKEKCAWNLWDRGTRRFDSWLRVVSKAARLNTSLGYVQIFQHQDDELLTENVACPLVTGNCIPCGARMESSYLVDPASSHMLVSKIKPCMSKYKQLCTVKLRMAH